MKKVAILMACCACTSYGRRVQSSTETLRSSRHEGNPRESKATDVVSKSRSDWRVSADAAQRHFIAFIPPGPRAPTPAGKSRGFTFRPVVTERLKRGGHYMSRMVSSPDVPADALRPSVAGEVVDQVSGLVSKAGGAAGTAVDQLTGVAGNLVDVAAAAAREAARQANDATGSLVDQVTVLAGKANSAAGSTFGLASDMVGSMPTMGSTTMISTLDRVSSAVSTAGIAAGAAVNAAGEETASAAAAALSGVRTAAAAVSATLPTEIQALLQSDDPNVRTATTALLVSVPIAAAAAIAAEIKESQGWFSGMPPSLYSSKITEADPLRRKTIELARSVGSDSPETIATLNEYAVAISNYGHQDEAELYMQQVLEFRNQTLGPEHPDTLKALNDYAGILNKLGRQAEAEAVMKGALEIRRKVLGPEDPITLAALNDYADTLGDLGRLGEADTLYKYVLDLSRRVLGPDHPETLRALRKYAGSDSGNYTGLLEFLNVMDTLSAEVPKLLSEEPNWDMFAKDFKVTDGSGVEVSGLDANKLLLQLLRRMREEFKEFVVDDEIQIVERQHEDGQGASHKFDPFLVARGIVELRLPLGPRKLPVDIEAETVFHIDDKHQVDYVHIEKLFLNGRQIKLLPGLKLSDDPSTILEKLRLWAQDIAEVQLLLVLRAARVLLSPDPTVTP